MIDHLDYYDITIINSFPFQDCNSITGNLKHRQTYLFTFIQLTEIVFRVDDN